MAEPAATAIEIVERIMTMHWDMGACRCWVCRDGRALGLRPRSGYPLWGDEDRPHVSAPEEKSRDG